VLANEEVIDGKSERGGHPVVRLPLRQWMLKITAYADRLDADLDDLDWPETKGKQHHWIGRSEGALVDFAVEGRSERVTVFTTRVDTLPGATYVVVAPEHPLVASLVTAANAEKVAAYVDGARRKSDLDRADASREKTGEPLGVFAENPANGDRIPIWVADYVIGAYGTGAVMAVPAHDERDHAFAVKYGLPIVQVVRPIDGRAVDVQASAFTDDGVAFGVRCEASVPDGTPSADVRALLVAWLAKAGRGGEKVTYRLHDWVFSRQRYWGEPIPIYFPVECDGDPRGNPAAKIRYDQPIAVDEKELPLALPDLEDFRPGTDPAGPLARVPEWRFFQREGRWYARETNTMPNWAGSCWYYLRFADPKNEKEVIGKEAYAAWLPVDLYVGGTEHAVLHLLYARFWHKVLFDMGIVADKEPFTRLVHQGLILGENGEKMSKSLGNVVNPDDVVRAHGADSLRVYEMFMGPLEQTKPWQTNGIEGVRRFLDRVWNVCTSPTSDAAGAYDEATQRLVHKTIKKVTLDIEGLRFNTAVSALMILVKHLGGLPVVPRAAARALALLVSPFAPHLGEELWQLLAPEESRPETVAFEPWPEFDPERCKDDVVEIGVQVNGKLRGVVLLALDADEAAARQAAMAEPNVKTHVEGKTLKKVVYVRGKILNFIVG
jgi:leucyl-tRNA synthetase